MSSSELEGFYKLSIKERRERLGLTQEECATLDSGLSLETANRMIENVIGLHALPVGVATNFLVNGRDYLVPFAIEEPSVVAAASKAAKIVRASGGFTATATAPVMIGQIQIIDAKPDAAKKILLNKASLVEKANALDKGLVARGGGCRDLECRIVESERGAFLVVHLLVDCRDAMGANAVNTMAEALAPELEALSGGRVRLRIISNLAVHRRANARAVFKKSIIGEDAVEGVLDAYAFAKADAYRCATNNKGVMNGVDAVCLATGNDWRAVEAGAHYWACRNGAPEPLCSYSKNADGDLVGEIDLPLAVATVGGASGTHPNAAIARRLLGVETASELAQVIACVGLAQNFAALYALSTVGIQRGHLKLHASNYAIMAGASDDQIEVIVNRMIKEKHISYARACEHFKELQSSKAARET
ncbi:MAG: hydroxymethylglutaryl-CoA reductase, degradative [Candidatus Micrarchaeia archaeon]